MGGASTAGDASDATSPSATDETGTSAASTDGDPCAGIELPLCDFCPDAMATLCGLPCDEPDLTCSNDIGDGMACADGAWQCSVHPPLGTGCNLVCVAQDGCTEIGCSDGLTILLVADGDGVTAGVYEVGIDADGIVETCTLEISDDPTVCQGGPPCVPDTTCNALVLLDPDETIQILIGVAADVTVTVQRDAEPPIEVADAPTYDVISPNGPGCGPACAIGMLEVDAL